MKHSLEEKETDKIRMLQLVVLMQTRIMAEKPGLSLLEGLKYIEQAKKFAVKLFPGKDSVFDLIYRPRMLRILGERGLLDTAKN